MRGVWGWPRQLNGHVSCLHHLAAVAVEGAPDVASVGMYRPLSDGVLQSEYEVISVDLSPLTMASVPRHVLLEFEGIKRDLEGPRSSS